MVDKALQRINGQVTEVPGTVTSAGAANAGQYPVLNPQGMLDPSMMPPGFSTDQYTSTAGGALTAGDLVYITSAGLISRASAAVGGVESFGFVTASSTTGAAATASLIQGRNTALSGLTVGARYYLSDTTPGAVTATPVSGAGKTSQFVGYAISASILGYQFEDGIVLG